MAGQVNVTEEKMEYAYYLIAVKKAKVTDAFCPKMILSGDANSGGIMLYPVNLLRNWIPQLHSRGHEMKMAIVEEFTRQGVDYWSTEIPTDRLRHIKRIYPETWQEYIRQY